MRSFHGVTVAHVADLVHLGRVRVARALAVLDHGALIPGSLPELVGHVHVLLGPGVPLGVIGQPGQAEVARAVVLGAGDDVPGDTAVGDVVQRGELAGELVRVGLEDVGGGGQADVLGHHGQGTQQHGRVVGGNLQPLVDVDGVVGVRVSVVAHHVREEHGVELGGLQGLGQLDPGVHVRELGLAGVLTSPLSVMDVAGGVHDEGVEVQRRGRGLVRLGHGGEPFDRSAPQDQPGRTQQIGDIRIWCPRERCTCRSRACRPNHHLEHPATARGLPSGQPGLRTGTRDSVPDPRRARRGVSSGPRHGPSCSPRPPRVAHRRSNRSRSSSSDPGTTE